MLLSILDVMSISVGYTRPIREGESYFNSGLLYGVGCLEKLGTLFKCQGLAVQTSAAAGKPHEIDVKFDISKEEGERVLEIKCSCIAGESGKCKHAVATVFWLSRHDEDELEDVSCTDLAQQWGKLKTSGKPNIEACPLSELCHVKDKIAVSDADKIPPVTEEMREKWKKTLMKCKLPTS